jgi:hypothetical protein
VLYTCCSVIVAKCVVLDVFGLANVEFDDVTEEVRPVLVEIDWVGEAVDMASAAGLVECGFSVSYPVGYEYTHTQMFGEAWHQLGAEAVLCRSASVLRIDPKGWMGGHEAWSELAIFTENAKTLPRIIQRREDREWLLG